MNKRKQERLNRVLEKLNITQTTLDDEPFAIVDSREQLSDFIDGKSGDHIPEDAGVVLLEVDYE